MKKQHVFFKTVDIPSFLVLVFNSNEATSVSNIANHPKTGCVGLQFLGAFWCFDVLEAPLTSAGGSRSCRC